MLNLDDVFTWNKLQNLGIRSCCKNCVYRYSEGQFGHIRYCKLDSH